MRWLVVVGLIGGCGGKDDIGPLGPDPRILEGPLTGIRVDGAADLTGDGAPDALISAPGLTGDGGVYLFSGTVEGRHGPESSAAALIGARAGDIGEGLSVCGDTNGDGHPDLLVGAPGSHAALGGAWLLHGPIAGDRSVDEADADLQGLDEDSAAGFAVDCSGDLDADGLYDLALSAPAADGLGVATSAGWVFFHAGTPEGPDAVASFTTTFSDSSLGADRSLLMHDLDGDGLSDAAIGAPGISRVHLVFGPVRGSFDANSVNALLGENDGAGHALAAGDLDGDGHPELVIGAPERSSGTGAVAILPGPIPPDTDGWIRDHGRWIVGQDLGERSGAAVAVASDVTGDGRGDILVGAPGAVTVGEEAGVVYVIAGPGQVEGVAAAAAVLLGSSPLGNFGHSLARVPDQDGDLLDEVIVGAPHQDVDGIVGTGMAYLFRGALAGTRDASAADATFVFPP